MPDVPLILFRIVPALNRIQDELQGKCHTAKGEQQQQQQQHFPWHFIQWVPPFLPSKPPPSPPRRHEQSFQTRSSITRIPKITTRHQPIFCNSISLCWMTIFFISPSSSSSSSFPHLAFSSPHRLHQAPCKPRPTPSPLLMALASTLLSLLLPISRILRPSINPLRPRFCNPTTALISPFHTSRSSIPLPSPKPLSDADAEADSDAAELTSSS